MKFTDNINTYYILCFFEAVVKNKCESICRMRGLIVLLAAVACCYGQGRRGRHLSKVELWPNRDVGQILSMNYPHTLPPNFDHEWIINGVPNSVILLRCSEVYQVLYIINL